MNFIRFRAFDVAFRLSGGDNEGKKSNWNKVIEKKENNQKTKFSLKKRQQTTQEDWEEVSTPYPTLESLISQENLKKMSRNRQSVSNQSRRREITEKEKFYVLDLYEKRKFDLCLEVASTHWSNAKIGGRTETQAP